MGLPLHHRNVPDAGIVQPLSDESTLFPKLPIELRVVIWKFALPNGAANDGKRVFCLHAQTVNDDTRLSLTFCLKPLCLTHCHMSSGRGPENMVIEYENWRKDMREVSLLRLCKESRNVFLDAFPHHLSAGHFGVIHFDNQTILHVEDWLDESLRNVLGQAIHQNLLLPSINTIRKIALAVHPFQLPHHEMLRLFGGLSYIGVHHLAVSFLPNLVENNHVATSASWGRQDTDFFGQCLLHDFSEIPSRRQYTGSGTFRLEVVYLLWLPIKGKGVGLTTFSELATCHGINHPVHSGNSRCYGICKQYFSTTNTSS